MTGRLDERLRQQNPRANNVQLGRQGETKKWAPGYLWTTISERQFPRVDLLLWTLCAKGWLGLATSLFAGRGKALTHRSNNSPLAWAGFVPFAQLAIPQHLNDLTFPFDL